MEFIIVGFILGILIGLTGMGGGMLTTPYLILIAGIPIPVAVGTSLLFSAITKFFGSFVYIFRGYICKKLTFLLLTGSIPGAFIGSYSLHYFYNRYPYLSEKVVPIIISILILISVLFSMYRIFNKSEYFDKIDIRNKPYLVSIIGFIVGFDVGFSSVGAGFLTASLLLAFCPLIPSRIVGTDIVHGLILTLFAGGIHLSLDGVNINILLELSSGGIVGVILGSLISPYIPQKPFKFALNSLILVFVFIFLRKVI